jgi:hypothetical protein
MSRPGFSIGFLAVLLFSSSAWAIPQKTSCRHNGRWQSHAQPGAQMCLLAQDPWQDCDEDPWQLSSVGATPDTFSDPWQDEADPWQPFVAEASTTAKQETAGDPWQPIVGQLVKAPATASALDSIEDPWQPAFADPWQDGAQDGTNDPWQMP